MFWMWAGFIGLVLALLALDIYVFHRRSHAVRMKEALLESCIWVGLAVAFSGVIYLAYSQHWHGLGLRGPHQPRDITGGHATVLFLTGYVIEESLSVDNLFVIAVVFRYFAIPPKYQHRVLFWGILGAQLMRGLMIGAGAALIAKFEWILYAFGVFLLYTAGRMLYADANPDPKNNLLIKLARRVFPVTHELHGHHFITREPDPAVVVVAEERAVTTSSTASTASTTTSTLTATSATAVAVAAPPARPAGRWALTPLALALLMVETTDLLFAVDSIPATFAVTTDPFLVFTSNIFAVLGLRAMYFALAGVLQKFKYLSYSLAAILALVGLKMLGQKWLHGIHHVSYWTLGLVVLFLAAGVIASVIANRRQRSGPGRAAVG